MVSVVPLFNGKVTRKKKSWIGVDFDGTLAHYEGWKGDYLGEPIKPMVARIHKWRNEGTEVRIFTARVAERDYGKKMHQVELIKVWCRKHLGYELPITCEKDAQMIELWDDRAVTVEKNTGRYSSFMMHDPDGDKPTFLEIRD